MYILKLKQGRVKQRVLKFFEDSLGKVSVQGVAVLGCHFATLCQEVDFYEAIFFFIINFQKEKANTFTLLIILIEVFKSSYIAKICYYDPQSAGINVQLPQSAATPRRLTLIYIIIFTQ